MNEYLVEHQGSLCDLHAAAMTTACDETLIRATEEELDGWMDGCMDGWMDGSMDLSMNGRIDGGICGWTIISSSKPREVDCVF